MDAVRDAVRWYAGNGSGANILLFPIFDEVRKIYAVNSVDYPLREGTAGVVVLARIIGDQVVIEEDATDRPLVTALMERGIARSQIVLAYEDEPIPDAALYEMD
ncbi:MAG: element excision factor XisI family protein [Chloroflexota bacterium]|nr:element excision factor XisI family protein [Chloroflexota bacterium]